MDLNQIMDSIGTQLATITGLRVYDFAADSVTVPAAVVGLPDSITYDFTFDRGSDELSLKVHVLVGKASDRNARDALSPYLTSSGPSSIKQVLEATPLSGIQTMRVESASVSAMAVGTVDYLAASYTVHVVA